MAMADVSTLSIQVTSFVGKDGVAGLLQGNTRALENLMGAVGQLAPLV